MDWLIFKNVRCFTKPKPAPLAPLTLLVGENSTGKSSFLALTRLAWDVAHGFGRIDFNEDPFLLGAFDQIAHFRGGRAGRAKEFEVGLESVLHTPVSEGDGAGAARKFRTVAKFAQSGSHPVIAEQSLQAEGFTLVARHEAGRPGLSFQVRSGEKRLTFSPDTSEIVRYQRDAPIDWMYLLYAVQRGPHRAPKGRTDIEGFSPAELRRLEEVISVLRFTESPRPVAYAPVRTKPQRTYNPVSDAPLPEGTHVPMVLARTFFEDKSEWRRLKEVLDRFGKASGLFEGLEIKLLGKHESDPFQIRIRFAGPPMNLMDVGYGISQVLPILVDAIMAPAGQIYLLQQPEVHLHPHGQAELGSFLAELVSNQQKRFIVETHSDYLIDRIRMDIRDKRTKLTPSDVAILFFERRDLDVQVHHMTIDESGNLLRAPSSYRRFFLGEERRFLSG